MKYYRTWTEALIDFVKLYGHNYLDSYNLAVEFDLALNRNRHGAYFILYGKHAIEQLEQGRKQGELE